MALSFEAFRDDGVLLRLRNELKWISYQLGLTERQELWPWWVRNQEVLGRDKIGWVSALVARLKRYGFGERKERLCD